MTGAWKGARDVPQCSACLRPSVIHLREQDRHLCAEHLAHHLHDRVRSTIASRCMVVQGDRIAVALSGGKDSTALLRILHSLLSSWDDVTLVAVTVDEGIAHYRDATIRSAERLVRELGVDHTVVTFTEIFGKGLDEILAGSNERACSVCGILRRRALSRAAQEAGATKLATGHNLDDEAQSVLMNALRGDLLRLVRDSGSPSRDCFIPRIKPLMDLSEKEIAVYLMVRDCFPDLPECPYTRYALRAEVRSRLSTFESRHPGTIRNLVAGKERLSAAFAGMSIGAEIGRCTQCGEPCSGTVCQTCRLLQDLRS